MRDGRRDDIKDRRTEGWIKGRHEGRHEGRKDEWTGVVRDRRNEGRRMGVRTEGKKGVKGGRAV